MWALVIAFVGIGGSWQTALPLDTKEACEAALVRVWSRTSFSGAELKSAKCSLVSDLFPGLAFERPSAMFPTGDK